MPDECTVLIIDDDQVVGTMYQLALSRAGFNVVVVLDGPSGLEAAESKKPGLILLDIRMPGMDGIEVLRVLSSKASTRQIPVVMLSNSDDSTHMSESRRLGAKEYLVKAATNPTELAKVARRWCRVGGFGASSTPAL